MKNKYDVEKKNINVTSALPLDQPWYERFDYLFASIAKIDGMSNGVDQGVYTTHRNNDIVNLSNEDQNVLRLKRFLHPL